MDCSLCVTKFCLLGSRQDSANEIVRTEGEDQMLSAVTESVADPEEDIEGNHYPQLKNIKYPVCIANKAVALSVHAQSTRLLAYTVEPLNVGPSYRRTQVS